MTNSEIISQVYEITENYYIFKGIADEKNVGTSQLVAMANVCKRADCVDEIFLLIEYKIAKGKGWNNAGRIILTKVKEIAESVQGTDQDKLKAISKFFGYLYWRVKSMEVQKNLK